MIFSPTLGLWLPEGTDPVTDLTEAVRQNGTILDDAVLAGDSRLLTAALQAALAGSEGTPGSGNKFLTEDDIGVGVQAFGTSTEAGLATYKPLPPWDGLSGVMTAVQGTKRLINKVNQPNQFAFAITDPTSSYVHQSARYLDPAWFDVAGKTTKVRLVANLFVNAVANGLTSLTYALSKLTVSPGASADYAKVATVASDVSSVTFNTFTANLESHQVGADATLTAGWYALTLITTGTWTANSTLSAELGVQYRQV